jgi:putative ABC transport system ATP-binding protein
MTQPLLQLREACRTYPMGDVEVRALRETQLDFWPGEFAVLFGPSGSGKSTLLNLIGGIDEPSSGEVLYLGTPLAGEAALEDHRRFRVGFVFQFYNLIPTLTALENVEMATMLADNPLSPIEALERVDLGDRRDHFPSQLSGGEQQRVSIARALAKRPTLLLCDEPTGALDPDTGRRILGLLRTINRELGTTVILVTHNGALGKLADRVIRLRGGAVVEDNPNPDPTAPEDIVW